MNLAAVAFPPRIELFRFAESLRSDMFVINIFMQDQYFIRVQVSANPPLTFRLSYEDG